MKRNIISFGFVFGTVMAVYWRWFFLPGVLSGGDWPYVWDQMARLFSLTPVYTREYLGFGATTLPFTPLEWYFQATGRLFVFLPWEIVERLFWFIPILIIGSYTSYQLTRSWIGALIYMTNTYILIHHLK